jgi:hypothetical protein
VFYQELFLDLNKLNGIALRINGFKLGFKTIYTRSNYCDGCNFKIVFASHNIVNMNGCEEEVLGKVPKQGEATNDVPLVKFEGYFRTKPFEKTL